MKEGVTTEGPPNADGDVGEAPSYIIVRPSFSARLVHADPRRPRLPSRLMLGTYVLLQEWDHPLANTVAPGPKANKEIIDRWSPFNKSESLASYMLNLYPTLLRLPMVVCVEEYSISFPDYLDRKSF